jgi:hypothetical protein
LREPRADFGKFDAWDRSVDDAERSPDASGCIGFRIEGVVMAGAAQGPYENAIDLSSRLPLFGPCLLLLQEQWQGDSHAAQTPDFEECAAVDAFTVADQAIHKA